MTALAAAFGVFALIFLCGILSYVMMFDDHTPSQNSYAWPYLLPTGFFGMLALAAVMTVAAIF